MDVTVYIPPTQCTYCDSTKLRLTQKKIPFNVVVTDDEMAMRFKEDGHASFPVVQVDLGDGADWSWSGFRWDHINRLADLAA